MKKAVLLSAILVMLLTACTSLPATQAVPQVSGSPSDDEVNAIARELFCPICQNTPLDVCPTEACRQWRELIRQMLSEGRSKEEIKQYFVENYGVRVLDAPPAEGINWLAYMVPPAAFLAGVFLLYQAFRTWKRESLPVESGPDLGPADEKKTGDLDEYAKRIEEELRKRR